MPGSIPIGLKKRKSFKGIWGGGGGGGRREPWRGEKKDGFHKKVNTGDELASGEQDCCG